jgi:hypothetical protein
MELVILVAALLISLMVFTWLVRVVKATISTAILIALIILALQLFLGIGPNEVWLAIQNLWNGIWQTLAGQ